MIADHPHSDPGDGRTECEVCGKWVYESIHSCKGVPVTEAAMMRYRAREERQREYDQLRAAARERQDDQVRYGVLAKRGDRAEFVGALFEDAAQAENVLESQRKKATNDLDEVEYVVCEVREVKQ